MRLHSSCWSEAHSTRPGFDALIGSTSTTPAPAPSPVPAQDAGAAAFDWPLPDGWKGETIPFPLGFAPDLP
jgi:hypothetical protein